MATINYCKHCKTLNLPDEDMHDSETCDNCFDAMMEQEGKDFDTFSSQKGRCALCNCDLVGWIVKNNQAICYPKCNG